MDTERSGDPEGSAGQDWDGVGVPPGAMFGTVRFRLGGIRCPVVITVFRADGGDGFYGITSHYIRLPGAFAPYIPSDYWFDSPAAAFDTLETGIRIQYDSAVRDGHVPDRTWLVSRLDHQRKRLGDLYPEPVAPSWVRLECP